jgi:putative ABC transport system permease protein
VLRAVVLAPLPYDNADRIVALRGLKDDRPFAFSLPDFADLHAGSKTLAAAAVSYGDQQVASVAGEPLSIALSTVTLGYFDVFAVAPQLGRFFSNADARAGAPKTIVIAERFWRTRLGAKPNIIGSTLAFDDAPYR